MLENRQPNVAAIKLGRRRVEVSCYAGYRGEEIPNSYTVDGKTCAIEQIYLAWVQQNADSLLVYRCFDIMDSDFHRVMLMHDEVSGFWFVDKGE